MYQLSVYLQFGLLRFWLALLLLVIFFFTSTAQFESQIDSLNSVLEKTEENSHRCRVLNDLARAALRVDPSSSHQYALRALDIAHTIDLPLQKARSYNYLGASALMMAQYEESLTHFIQAKKAFLDIGDEKGAADVIGNMGYIYIQKGNYDEALDIEFEALNLFEKVDDTAGICNTNQLIANIFMETGNFDQALKYDSVALSCFRGIGDRQGEAMVLGNLANIFSEQGELEKAKSLQLKAINIFEEIESPLDMGRELGNLSATYESMKELKSAIATTEQSLNIFFNANYEMAIPIAEGNLGAYYLTSFQLSQSGDSTAQYPEGTPEQYLNLALQHLQAAYDRASSDQNVVFSGWLSEKLADTYELLGNMPMALNYYKIADEIQDSVYSMETKAEIEKLTTQREIELREKQIELDRLAVQKKRNERRYFILGLMLLTVMLILIYRNYRNQRLSNELLEEKNTSLANTLDELKATQEQLIESERQKEKAQLRSRISQDIHDDISSGLTKISWLIESLRLKYQRNAEGIDKLLDKIHLASKSTVSKLGEIIWSTSPERDNLGSLLTYMRKHITEFMDDSEIAYSINFTDEENSPVDPEVRRNLFLILKEALNNVFKYSQAKNVEISFTTKGGKYAMVVADNGIGMEDGTIKGGGHGLSGMERRSQAIAASLSIESKVGHGVIITCKGPLETA